MLTNPLSAIFIEKLKEDGTPRKNGKEVWKSYDGQELAIEAIGNSWGWTYEYSWRGKRPELALGTFPKIGVADARELRAKLRDARDRGIDPERCGHRESKNDQINRLLAFSRLEYGRWTVS